jgi:hypothetical protein
LATPAITVKAQNYRLLLILTIKQHRYRSTPIPHAWLGEFYWEFDKKREKKPNFVNAKKLLFSESPTMFFFST